MAQVLMETDLKDVKFLRRGKVRDVYETDDYFLIIATDRVSAFDVVLPNGIPDKGRVLTQISIYWFNQMKDIIENHIVATDVKDYPEILHKYKDILEGRSMLVKKAKPMPVECIVRGYLSGSGWKEYKKSGTVCGIKLPDGLVESSRLDEPIFTPSTKAEEGHDINISFDEMKNIVGEETANKLRDTSLRVYKKAREMAEKKGIIIADTKMEFGIIEGSEGQSVKGSKTEGKLILIDEVLTPDSSRFWSMKDYKPGKSQDSFDKQIVRDYLLTLDWNQTYPGPKLPDEIVEKTAARYREILGILTG
ncbi:MAG: phosphoribosylaminoimidazolesuccinocarboxamide synthase [Thermodesulfovibrionales bacterium]|nr:phosphoribosylaminoimidazolesuccinocarboxamide synthase [Thermodesulfovibrionales bacterium]